LRIRALWRGGRVANQFQWRLVVPMDDATSENEARFSAYVEALAGVIGHTNRVGPLTDYCIGLILPGERKSVEPMAAVIAPTRASAEHQSLLHFVGQSRWSDEAVLAKVRELVLPAIESSGPIEAWIVDDTGFPKKGVHSVGVARQYCGRLGKQDNCQVAVSLSVANHTASLPIAYQLYLPEEWAGATARRAQAHVPETITFQTKPEIALKQIKTALEAGIPAGVALADAGYGVDAKFRSGLTALGLAYVVGVQSTLSVWPPGMEPLPPPPWAARGRTPTRLRRDSEHQPVSAKQLSMNLPSDAWREVTWREGTNDPLCSRFAAVRIRPASRDWLLDRPHSYEWLLIEWPTDEKEPTKYWLSTLPEDATLLTLVDMAKLRWRIERDYQELKSELGLAHFEGRGWRGFHHHATLCIAAYGFLIRERAAIPPSGPMQREKSRLSFRRGSGEPAAATRAPRRQFNRDNPQAPHLRARQNPVSMPMLQGDQASENRLPQQFVTQ
jgi:SRSO17 transposase